MSHIFSEIDFNQNGKQTGFLRLPHSVHRSAYGWIPIPIVMIKNGEGPTVLLMSGNHGDEYEGQVTICKLVQELEAEDIQGRLIMLPMANYPAALAGLRTSPIDEGNLNRTFPGNKDGNPTQIIADYIETVLLPLCDYLLDMHSGGSSLIYPTTILRPKAESPEEDEIMAKLQEVFDAPYGIIMAAGSGADPRVSSAAAQRNGVRALGTEAGGSGTVSPKILAEVDRGVRRYLNHIGILPGYTPDAPHGIRLMEMTSDAHFVFARDEGLFEPYVEICTEVKKDQAAGAIHHPETPWVEPTICYFKRDGLAVCKRVPGRVQRGDCLFHLITDIE
ncbi:MAG: deacylase [Alphaproteobacteria bacterium]|jgi:hypothetical protein|nr:deacylase [Alphaproteobacteria bacterium]MBT4084905.1 deacylase [Alphaproteobacteria bacterium]MBT4544096.1 deacylase [Alphaproteobacteria bacterium]MBT7747535.1 deacylase [Alphaproteobacteria bacterium]